MLPHQQVLMRLRTASSSHGGTQNMTTSVPHPLLHESATMGAARLAARHEGRVATARLRRSSPTVWPPPPGSPPDWSSDRTAAHLRRRTEGHGLAAAGVLFVRAQNSRRSLFAAVLLARRATVP